MTIGIIQEPYDRQWLAHVSASHDEVQGEVPDLNMHMLLSEENGISDACNADTRDDEGVAVFDSIRGESREKNDDASDNIDRDRHNLGADRSPSKLT